ncbi:MAG: hypothetical protein ACE5H1_07945 [Thermodesulfobacteriota bacterium]
MILWFIVGFIVWALCILFMLAIFKGGNTTHGYEQKLHYRNMVNTQKVRDSIKGVTKGTASVLHS